MSQFTNRIARDLNQIADRATPSSTAWDAIQQRIVEQDTQPTMEVIVLDPDQKPSLSRITKFAGGALAAAAVLIGALLIINSGGDDESVRATTPDSIDSTTPVDPDQTVAPAGDGGEAVGLATSGEMVADCIFGDPVLNEDTGRSDAAHDCTFRDTSAALPFDAEQQWVFSLVPRQVGDIGVTAVGLSDNGIMYGGYLAPGENGDDGWFVGAGEGVGDFEGQTLYFTGRLLSTDPSALYFDWTTDPGLVAASPTDSPGDVTAMVTFDCGSSFIEDIGRVASYTQSCEVQGDDPDLTAAFAGGFDVFAPDPLDGVPEGMQYLVGRYEDGSVAAGLFDADQLSRVALMGPGTGEYAGSFVHSMAVGQGDDLGNLDSTVRRTVRPDNSPARPPRFSNNTVDGGSQFFTDALGMGIQFTLPQRLAAIYNRAGEFQLAGGDTGFDQVIGARIGGWYTAAEAADPDFVGQGSIAANDVDGWIADLGLVAEQLPNATVAGRTARVYQFELPDDSNVQFDPECPGPCAYLFSVPEVSLDEGTTRADNRAVNDRFVVRMWFVEVEGSDPLALFVAESNQNEGWMDEFEQLVLPTIELAPDGPSFEAS